MADDAALTFVAKMDDQASKAASTLEKNLDDLGGPLKPITGKADLEVTGFEALEGLDRAAEEAFKDIPEEADESGKESGSRFGDGLKAGLAAGAVAGAAAFAAKLLSDSFNNALEQETDTAKITASLGLNPEESARAGKVAGTLYANAYGDSFGDVTGAVESVMSSIGGMRSASGSDLQGVTEDALNFASAFDIDVARSTQQVGQLIRTGLVSDAEEGFDLLVAASQKVPANIREDLLDAADEYAPFFAALGFSGAAAFDTLTLASSKGMYGIDKTGDALKEFGIRATDLSPATSAAFKAIGLDSQTMADQLLAGGDTAGAAFQQTIDGLLAITDPAAQAQAAISLFGTPLEDLGVSEIPEFLASLDTGSDGLGDFQQASEDLSDTLNGTAANALESQRREIEQMGTDALATLMPYLIDFLHWAQQTPGFITAVAVALGLAAVAWAAVTLAASPWLALGLAIAAVIAGLVFVVMNWGNIMEWLDEKVGVAVDWISDKFTALKDWVTGKVGELIGWVKANWPLILAILAGPLGLAIRFIAQHMDEIKAAVSNGLQNVITFFRELPGRVIAALGNFAGMLAGQGRDLVRGLWEGITGMGKWLMDKLSGWAKSVIPGPIAKALGINSPSKVGAELGGWFAIGIGDGVEDETAYVERSSANLADAMTEPLANLDASMGNLEAPTVSVAGRSDVSTVVEIRHVITSPDGSVTTMTAQQVADLIAGDPTAAATTEKAVRGAVQRRDARTLAATNA